MVVLFCEVHGEFMLEKRSQRSHIEARDTLQEGIPIACNACLCCSFSFCFFFYLENFDCTSRGMIIASTILFVLNLFFSLSFLTVIYGLCLFVFIIIILVCNLSACLIPNDTLKNCNEANSIFFPTVFRLDQPVP